MLIHKNLLYFLYSSNEQSENEFKMTVLFTVASKGIKYVGINLTKMKDLYTENYKTGCKNLKTSK